MLNIEHSLDSAKNSAHSSYTSTATGEAKERNGQLTNRMPTNPLFNMMQNMPQQPNTGYAAAAPGSFMMNQQVPTMAPAAPAMATASMPQAPAAPAMAAAPSTTVTATSTTPVNTTTTTANNTAAPAANGENKTNQQQGRLGGSNYAHCA